MRHVVRSGLRLTTVSGLLLVASSLFAGELAVAADVIQRPTDIAVSPNGSRIFTSWGGHDGGGITVLDPSGTITGEIDDPGVSRLAIGAGALFAANVDDSTIDRFDLSTSTPTPAGVFAVPDGLYPLSLAWSGSHLFVVAGSPSELRIYAVEPDGSPWTDVTPVGVEVGSSTQVVAVPGGSKIVIVSGAFAGVFTATVPLSGAHTGTLPSVYDGTPEMAVEADGEHLLTGNYDTYGPREFSLADFSEGTPYAAGIERNPAVIATNANATRFAVGASVSQSNDAVALYDPGTAEPVARYSTGFGASALAFSPNGDSLYVVWFGDDLQYRLSTIDPAVSDASVGLTLSPKRPIAGSLATLSVHLDGGSTNRTVTVHQREVGEPATVIATAAVDGSGDLVLELHPHHYVEYWATYDGDALWNPAATERLNVDVGALAHIRLLREYGTDGAYALYHRASRVSAKVWTTPLEPHEDIQFGLEVKLHHRWHEWFGPDPYSMGSTGRIVLYLPGSFLPTGRYRFTAQFLGSDDVAQSDVTFALFRVTR